jgi:hypothetical protein
MRIRGCSERARHTLAHHRFGQGEIARSERDLFGDREGRAAEGLRGNLSDELDHRCTFARAVVAPRASVHRHGAALGVEKAAVGQEAGEPPAKRRLPGAVWCEDRHAFARIDGERDAVERRLRRARKTEREVCDD